MINNKKRLNAVELSLFFNTIYFLVSSLLGVATI